MQLVYATPITQPDLWKNGEKRVLDRFMQEYPEIEVIGRQIPFESYDTQVLLSVRGGHAPDVARINHVTLPMWAGAGYLQPLDAFIARSEVIDPDDYWPGFWSFCRIDGRQWAVPLGTDCRVLYYHLGLFTKHGIDRPPADWAELVEFGQRIQDPENKVYGFAVPTATEWDLAYNALGCFLVANDGRILNEAGTAAVFADNPNAREAFTFACDLVTRYKVTPPGMTHLTGDVIEALFYDGRIGMMFGGPFTRDNLKRLDEQFLWNQDYGMALIPSGPATDQSGSAQGGWLIGAFADSRHPEAALKLLEFMSRPQSLAIIAAVENIPPRRAAMAFEPFEEPFYEIYAEQLKTSRPPLKIVPQLPNIAKALRRAYQRVIAGGATADEAIAWLDDKITNHLLR